LLTVPLSAESDDLDTSVALARIQYVELLEDTFMADTALKIIIQNLSNVAQVGGDDMKEFMMRTKWVRVMELMDEIPETK
jgi:hypothetical protein